ncbi:MAG: DUF3047 domain-containing protein [Thermodesulfobacteriota bacterium]
MKPINTLFFSKKRGSLFFLSRPMVMSFITLLGLVFFPPHGTTTAAPPEVKVGTFTQDEMASWEERVFKGHTTYELVGEVPGLALRATCNGSASAFYRRISVDLKRTPMLHWSWRVDGVHHGLDETTKAGDDYAARVYVVYTANSLLPWRVKAVDYVWSNSRPVGSHWPNAFTDRVMMVALRSGPPAKPVQWMSEVRNVREDFKTFWGLDITSIDGLAVMTDCDNGGGQATGYYRDIRFTAE